MDYTKGEWKINELPTSEYPNGVTSYGLKISIQSEDNPRGICYLTDRFISSPKEEEMLANAHLISACPDMYEALKKLTTIVRDLELKGQDTIRYPELYQAEKALAKAEGKQ